MYAAAEPHNDHRTEPVEFRILYLVCSIYHAMGKIEHNICTIGKMVIIFWWEFDVGTLGSSICTIRYKDFPASTVDLRFSVTPFVPSAIVLILGNLDIYFTEYAFFKHK